MNDPPPLPLRDIHLPDPVSWWPPAYGWWLLALAGVLALMLAGWRLARGAPWRRRLARPRALALRELDEVGARFRESGDPRAAAAAASQVLRRFALEIAPREDVAALTGDRWLAWLRERCDAPAVQATARALCRGAYQPHPQLDVTALLANCRAFVTSARETAGAP